MPNDKGQGRVAPVSFWTCGQANKQIKAREAKKAKEKGV